MKSISETGASLDPCSQNFAGPHAASEPETRAISNYVLNLNSSGRILYYFAIHSYSQMTFIPHSHLTGENVLQVSNFGDLVRPLHYLLRKTAYITC